MIIPLKNDSTSKINFQEKLIDKFLKYFYTFQTNMLEMQTEFTFKMKVLGGRTKMVEQKDMLSLPLARTPESQLTAEQSSTGRHWNS